MYIQTREPKYTYILRILRTNLIRKEAKALSLSSSPSALPDSRVNVSLARSPPLQLIRTSRLPLFHELRGGRTHCGVHTYVHLMNQAPSPNRYLALAPESPYIDSARVLNLATTAVALTIEKTSCPVLNLHLLQSSNRVILSLDVCEEALRTLFSIHSYVILRGSLLCRRLCETRLTSYFSGYWVLTKQI